MSAIATYPSLAGKTVIVSGGGSGIGESITSHFARQGARVGFLDIADDASQGLEAHLNAEGHQTCYVRCNVTDTDALRAAIDTVRETFGPIGVLINNAAHDERHRLEDVTPDYWDERIAINLKHQFFAAQAVVADMKQLGGGSIINMGSISWMIGNGGMACYTASKSAVLGLTSSLARDLGEFNIRVNSIAPGWIMTERQKTLWATPEALEKHRDRQCLPDLIDPVYVARMVVFLASDDAAMCSASSFIVDAGSI